MILLNNIRLSIHLFADDTTIYINIDNPQNAAFILNTDIETINGWSPDWLVDFNPTKTSTHLISQRQHPVFHPSLVMNNVVLSETTSHNHLNHIQYMFLDRAHK